MKTNEIRQAFLDYYVDHGHTKVASSPLIPQNDPTLLFVNAGMVQFKDIFLGQEKRDYSRATTSQRCVRAGGKHNDLDNVGYTARHHTFFEMLGNFSFGDYFKEEAIQFAWDFLTKVLKLPKEKLWVTVYKDDKESEDIWFNKIGIDQSHFSRCGEKDNFWAMGDTGPCGPCSEIFYDHGEDIAGGPPGSPDEDGDRYIEIWNLVFMQYNRQPDGKLLPLPKPSVDTGMGLERIAAVMQNVHNNYEIDLFDDLITAICKISNQNSDMNGKANHSLRVIADHIRSVSFMIIDGVLPSNEGRGYVLRRILRRALRHGFKLGLSEPFFHQIVPTLVELMGEAYPELKVSEKFIMTTIKAEENQFMETLARGMKILEQEMQDKTTLSGSLCFKLYDTYGFPPDLTADIARERDWTVDEAGFEKAMAEQKAKSKASSEFAKSYIQGLDDIAETKFLGYDLLESEAKILALVKGEAAVGQLNKDDKGIVILDQTPFYAESGGQVGDRGVVEGEGFRFTVKDVQKQGGLFYHFGVVSEGELTVGLTVDAKVDKVRDEIRANHSATHILHEALKRVLGSHVQQKGSMVASDRLRLDFSHQAALSHEEIRQVESMVNTIIRDNIHLKTDVMDIDSAKESGAVALFGEKYGDKVRVVNMGDFSKELCGGTHVNRTGDIGLFKIVLETSIAAGVRRIEAMTGDAALEFVNRDEDQLKVVLDLMTADKHSVLEKLQTLIDEKKLLQKELSQLAQKMASESAKDLSAHIKVVGDIEVLAVNLGAVDRGTLRQMVDQLKSEHDRLAVVLASVIDGKIILIAGVSKGAIDTVTAPQLLKIVTDVVGGKGGGRPDLAQGGGEDVERLGDALAGVYESQWLPRI